MTGDTDNKRLVLGLIGCGRWGENYLRTFQKLHPEINAKIDHVAIGSRNFSVAEAYGAKTWSDHNTMFKEVQLDGVIIATPASSHWGQAYDAMCAHIPVLLEKPATLTGQSTLGLLELAQMKEVPCLVNHIHLRSQGFNRLRACCHGYMLKQITSSGCNRGPFRNHAHGTDMAVLWDWLPHEFSMLDALGVDITALKLLSYECKDVHFSKDRSGLGPTEKLKQRGELWRLEMQSPGDVKISLKVGNAADEKERKIVIETSHGKRYKWDDAAVQWCVMEETSHKMEPEPTEPQKALDLVCREFAHMIRYPRLFGDNKDLKLACRVAGAIEHTIKEIRRIS